MPIEAVSSSYYPSFHSYMFIKNKEKAQKLKQEKEMWLEIET